jgi:hypothetical protein
MLGVAAGFLRTLSPPGAAIKAPLRLPTTYVRLLACQGNPMRRALARKLNELERKYQHHDDAIAAILSAIRELMHRPPSKRRPIGFTANIDEKS